jgi:hypothetical protein
VEVGTILPRFSFLPLWLPTVVQLFFEFVHPSSTVANCSYSCWQVLEHGYAVAVFLQSSTTPISRRGAILERHPWHVLWFFHPVNNRRGVRPRSSRDQDSSTQYHGNQVAAEIWLGEDHLYRYYRDFRSLFRSTFVRRIQAQGLIVIKTWHYVLPT